MPLSTKLIADYTEMINQQLDSIPLKKRDDFKVVIGELEKLLEKTVESIGFNPFFKEYVESIFTCLGQPEMYVKSKEDYLEYQDVIKKRIQGKIIELKSFDGFQQDAYILNQEKLRKHAEKDQQIMAGHEIKRPKEVAVTQKKQSVSFFQSQTDSDLAWRRHENLLNLFDSHYLSGGLTSLGLLSGIM